MDTGGLGVIHFKRRSCLFSNIYIQFYKFPSKHLTSFDWWPFHFHLCQNILKFLLRFLLLTHGLFRSFGLLEVHLILQCTYVLQSSSSLHDVDFQFGPMGSASAHCATSALLLSALGCVSLGGGLSWVRWNGSSYLFQGGGSGLLACLSAVTTQPVSEILVKAFWTS